jgi:uncharacterized protein YeaO (DUF488 family)
VIKVKPAYDPRSKDDGYRLLVVHDWPQGLPRGKASGCDWVKSLGPTESLLGWMRKNPRKLDQFVDKYLAELGKNDSATRKICAMHERFGAVTVLSVPAVDDHWPIADTLARFLAATCDLG